MTFSSFGLVLKNGREKAGYTQRELAVALGFGSAQAVSNAERGLASIAPKHFRKLSRMIDVPIERLIDTHIEDYRRGLHRKARTKAKASPESEGSPE